MKSVEIRGALKKLYEMRSKNIVETIALLDEMEKINARRNEMIAERDKIDDEIIRIRNTPVSE